MRHLGLRYESAYTMEDDGNTVIIEDMITFTLDGDELLGKGEVDEDGLTMTLRVTPGEDRLVGQWEERDVDDKVIHGGALVLEVVNQGLLEGEWSAEGDSGRWVMTLANQSSHSE